MFELKRISRDAIPAALEKAERYRLLNQPRPAESICLDILSIEPTNQQALIMRLLCLTDQFGKPGHGVTANEALEVLGRVEGAYERAYYEGVIYERWGKAFLPGAATLGPALDWIRKAMTVFERAQSMSPPLNDDAILRWNACARLITRLEKQSPVSQEAAGDAAYSDDAPIR